MSPRLWFFASLAFAILVTMVSCGPLGQFLGVNPDTGEILPSSPADTLVNAGKAIGIPWMAWLAPVLGLARWGFSEVSKIRAQAREKKYFEAAKSTIGTLEAFFIKADSNGDGKIDAEELKKALFDGHVVSGSLPTIQDILSLVKLVK